MRKHTESVDSGDSFPPKCEYINMWVYKNVQKKKNPCESQSVDMDKQVS